MKIKIELEVEVFTQWHEVVGCTLDTFAEYVKFILTEEIAPTEIIDSDLEYKINLLKYEVQ